MKKRILWKDSEWVQVARELYRIRPVDEYLRSTSMAGLQTEDFFAAQRVLPEDRRRSRSAVQSMSVVRPGLVKAMAVIRAEVDAEILRKKAEAEVAELEAQAVKEVAKLAIPELNQYEAAFAPLIDLIATEVTKRIQDMLAATMPNVLAHKVTSKTQPKKLKFGVIGPLSIQGQEIKKAFPEMDFVIVESSKANSSLSHVSGCDKIIGMTDFMDHSTDNSLRARFPDRYHRTTGGTSKVKHLIGILASSIKAAA
ncbi:hypothetical protein [Acinetobacter sp.]|uniref:hypothetical protein n=1 Tax=Acinetobacter sp. TaxID=472 RepID=UPI00388D78BA